MERDELASAGAELLVVEVDLNTGVYGAQALYWLSGPWGEAERVLALAATPLRQRQIADLRSALRSADAVGPFRLERRPTSAGRSAWALVPAAAGDGSSERGDG
jgi:hypothetical protein